MTNISERILRRCMPDGDCLIWHGAVNAKGYGNIYVDGRYTSTHRAIYEYVNGPIPEGLVIDHVKARGCNSTACCNVAHLEAVTQRVNLLRGDTGNAKNVLKTHCPAGHVLSGDNLIAAQLRVGKRVCRACDNARQREKHARLKLVLP